MTKHTIRQVDIARFTEGDCHIFAKALYDLTGWAMHAFIYADGPDTHAFVVAPDGRAVDIEGPQPIRAFRAKWEKWCSGKHREFTWKEMRANGWSPHPQVSMWSPRRAKQLAPLIVASYYDTLDE